MKNTFPLRQAVSEFFGTFVLTYAVSASLTLNYAIATPLIAALVLMTLAYLLGPVSGAHVNPAVTVALFSLRKMSFTEAATYIVSQLLGAFVASLLLQRLISPRELVSGDTTQSVIGELLGTFVFVFGVSTVVQRRGGDTGGLVVGLSLLTGIAVASAASLGIINPAVALGLGVLNPSDVSTLGANLFAYALVPLIGGFLGAQASKWLIGKN
jgi:glycerol uptake facilitator-like aquaporin